MIFILSSSHETDLELESVLTNERISEISRLMEFYVFYHQHRGYIAGRGKCDLRQRREILGNVNCSVVWDGGVSSSVA